MSTQTEADVRRFANAHLVPSGLVAFLSLIGQAGLALAPDPLVAAAAAAHALAAIVGFTASFRLRASLLRDAGDLMLENGRLVERRAYSAWLLAHQAWAAVAVGAVAVDAASVTADLTDPLAIWRLVAAVVGPVVALAFGVRFRRVRRALEAHVALLEGRLDDCARWLRGQPDDANSRTLLASLALRRGDADGGLRDLERQWSGDLDAAAATIAWHRLGRTGDAALADRWLAAAPEPRDRYRRFLRAWVEGTRRALAGDGDGALAALAAADRDLPLWFDRQLGLVRIAALRAAGRAGEADAALAPIRDEEAWRRATHPRLWSAVTGEAAAPPPPLPPVPPSSPFAPPRTPHVVAAPRIATTEGAVPVEDQVLAMRPVGPFRELVRAVGGLTLLSLAPLLAAFGLLWGALGDEPLLAAASFGGAALALLLGAAPAVRALAPTGSDPDGVVVLGSGRRVRRDAWRWFVLDTTAPLASPVALFALAWGLSELGTDGGLLVAAICVPAALLFGLLVAVRLRALAVVRAAHDPEPVPAIAAALARWPSDRAHGRVWLALAELRSGRLAEAEAAAADVPAAAFVRLWLRAGRGEVDLARLLAEDPGEGLGPRYRAAVAAAVAALAAGRADLVAARVAAWEEVADQLPNVWGALLRRLAVGVRRAGGAEGLEDPPDTAFVRELWPFVP